MEKTIIILLSIILITIGISSCSDDKKGNDVESVSTEQPTDTLILDETDDLTPISKNIECVGKVELPPQAKYSIHAKVQGYVKSVKLIEGQAVKKGSVLAVIESPAFAILQKDFLRASANYTFAKSNFERRQKLTENQSVSEKEMQKTEMEMKVALADYRGRKAQLELMGFQTLEIEKGKIQKSLAIFSPISGYVTRVTINNGKKLSPDDLLFEIIDKSKVHIKMQVNSKDVSMLNEGDKFTVLMPGEKREFSGELHYINKQIEAETNTVIIHGHLNNTLDASDLLVGSIVFIRFKL